MGLMLPQQLVDVIRAGQWGRAGRQADSQAHHTEHLWTGFMGESLGQWKARPNSSNWDTLPRTLGWGGRDPSSVSFASYPGAFSGLTHVPSCPSAHMQTQEGDWLPRKAGGRAYR